MGLGTSPSGMMSFCLRAVTGSGWGTADISTWV